MWPCTRSENFDMKTVLDHPEKTLLKIAHDVYTEKESDFALASIFAVLSDTKSLPSKVAFFSFFCFGIAFSRLMVQLVQLVQVQLKGQYHRLRMPR